MDFLEIDGQAPISACSAKWCPKSLVGLGGELCSRAKLCFDPSNPSGLKAWGKTAAGAIVVAKRGASFDHVARNAEVAGACALVIVDNRDVWKHDTELCPRQALSKAGDLSKPEPCIPTILVPKECENILCCRAGLSAVIVRRKFSGEVAKPHVKALMAPLRRRITRILRKDADCLHLIGQGEPVPGCSSEWTRKIKPRRNNGQICGLAPIFFDENNQDGLGRWPTQARSAILVARRGASFELLARNAERAGATALVIVNNRDEWDEDFEIKQEKPPIQDTPPAVPTILVPSRLEPLLCGGASGFRTFRAVLVRKAIETNTEESQSPGVVSNLRTY
eukprot:CAMPEP_0178401734 /NCGR_PEP_ID=MMETSP0689_2-20121128/16458_1 /TAXON_ID=160604 /ORGANISM="Amphidinium massartii, Strain CS-259" /LENGTH=335 /DNA_ID=CAMNT_0020022571 /DNA_START=156 /DNA_END=1163 /DNA_ORIENTATION=+